MGLRNGLFVRFVVLCVVSNIFFFSSFFLFSICHTVNETPFYLPTLFRTYTDKRGKVKMDVTPYEQGFSRSSKIANFSVYGGKYKNVDFSYRAAVFKPSSTSIIE